MDNQKQNNKIKTLILRISSPEHKILKKYCFEQEISMQQYFLKALREKLTNDGLIERS